MKHEPDGTFSGELRGKLCGELAGDSEPEDLELASRQGMEEASKAKLLAEAGGEVQETVDSAAGNDGLGQHEKDDGSIVTAVL